MNASPVVSVCIANYNGMGMIDACVASVQNQDCIFPFEILIHDDASTDGSAAHIKATYPNARVIESNENVGYCVSNNRMVDAALGEFILLLNNDAELFPDALRTLYQAATAIGRPAILSLPQYDAERGELIDIGSLFDPFLNPIPNLNENRQDVAMVIGACLWIPTSLWRELGGFPAWFGSIAEDMYLCCRTRLAGYTVRCLSSSGYRHWQGKSFGGNRVTDKRLVTTFRRRALSERNKTFVMVICYPGLLLVWLMPLHLFLIHLEGLLLTLIKGNSDVWHKIYAPLLPALWHQRYTLLTMRRLTHAQRKASLRTWLAPFKWMPWKLKMLIRHGLPNLT